MFDPSRFDVDTALTPDSHDGRDASQGRAPGSDAVSAAEGAGPRGEIEMEGGFVLTAQEHPGAQTPSGEPEADARDRRFALASPSRPGSPTRMTAPGRDVPEGSGDSGPMPQLPGLSCVPTS